MKLLGKGVYKKKKKKGKVGDIGQGKIRLKVNTYNTKQIAVLVYVVYVYPIHMP